MSDDVSSGFMVKSSKVEAGNSVRDMEEWMRTFEAGDQAGVPPFVEPIVQSQPEFKPLAQPKPIRRKTDDQMGRPSTEGDSTIGTVMRNVAEVPGQAVRGVHDAVMNATSWAIDPLANWLNDNVADLRYDPKDMPVIHDPRTGTGEVTREISKFLTGFIPAIKGLKAAGMAGKVAPAVTAGAISDFSVRSGNEARLADLWQKMELPKNILTDYLSHTETGLSTLVTGKPVSKNESEIEGRFKNALEGVGLGALTEGVFLAAKALKAARGVKQVQADEITYLRGKYGEVTDENIADTGLGDAAKPLVAVEKQAAPVAGAKQPVDVPNLDARALIRGTPRKAPAVSSESVSDASSRITSESGVSVIMEQGTAGQIKLSSITVPADARGAGKGSEALAAVKKYADDTGNKVVLTASTTKELQPKLEQFYERNGFARFGVDPLSGASYYGYKPKQVASENAPEMYYHTTGADVGDDLNPISYVTKSKEGSATYAEKWGEGAVTKEIQINPSAIKAAGFKDLQQAHKDITGAPLRDEKRVASFLEDFLDSEDNPALRNWLKAKGFNAVKFKDTVYGADTPMESMVLLNKSSTYAPKPASAIKSEDFDVYVNFARFDEPDSVKFAIGKMAEAAKGSIDEATRGKITQVETEKMAEDLGMSVADLLARRKGQGFNAEEAVAARQLWAASGEKLVELAKKAASKDASPLDHFAFRKMMATHSAIQAEVVGARTETARALASWAIPVKGGVERARLVDQVLQSTGGVETSAEMAKRLAILADSGASPAAIGHFAFKGYGAATSDAIKELWVNGLLSSPKTHVINTMSNTVTAFQSIYERGAAGAINKMAGGGVDGVQMGEAVAMAHGLIGGVKDSFRLAAQYLKTGQSQFNFGKVDIIKPEAISAEAFNMSRGTGTGRFVDFLGKVVGTPMHLLGAEDEFFKSIGYRMEVRAQALRSASQEGHQGEALVKRIAELTDNPTEAIRINAADAALYNTFTNEMGAFGRAVMNLRNIDHPLNPAVFVMPFVRTPVNIARYAFERTPFAPLVSQWRADIAAGGARSDLALARMATGTAIMLTAMDYADLGVISGEGPKGDDKDIREALMRQGWQPYSVKVGDRWYSYNRADPFGMTIGFAASIAEAVKKGELDEDDVDEWQEVTAMTIAAVSQVAISKTYLEGFSKFVEVLSDPKRHSESYVNQLFASFLPATSLNAAVKNFMDPVQREAGSPIEAVQSRIAGLSENLPPRRNLWGEQVTGESGLGRVYDTLTPVQSKSIVESPIDKEMVRLQDAPLRIAKRTIFDGVQANFKQFPKAYDDYVRLAGNELKHPAWQMGAKDYLTAVVSGAHPMSAAYSIMSDESRKAFIRNAVQDYRKLAQQQVLADPKHAGFAREVAFLKNNKFENRMPVLGEMK